MKFKVLFLVGLLLFTPYCYANLIIPAIKGDKGDCGINGTTPVLGVDYFNGTNGSPGPNQVTTSTTTNITGLLKGIGSVIAQASAGSDYIATEVDPYKNIARYTTVKSGAGSHIAAKVAGNYIFPPAGGVMAVGGTGTLYPQQVFYLTGADYPTINGIATKLRVKGSVFCNDVSPFTGTFTFGLHPITRPGTSGGAGLCIYTIGTVVSGSTAVVTNAAADSSNNVIGSDFAIPADGWYALVCVTSATMATSAHVHLTCELQMRNN